MAITLLTLKEAAEQYGLSLEQLRDLARHGKMNIVTLDGQEMVSDDEVRKVAGNNGNHVHWVALKDAARQYALDEALLERLAKDGVVRSGILEDELHLAVEDIEPVFARLNRANFQSMEGQPIELARASEQYGFSLQVLRRWAKRGCIRMIKATRRPILLNEADVAYARALAEVRGISKGKALFPSSRQYSPNWLYR